jgi:hypothetical protein
LPAYGSKFCCQTTDATLHQMRSRAAVAVVDRVQDVQQVQRLADAAVLGERLPERGGAAASGEHPQQVIGADLVDDQ